MYGTKKYEVNVVSVCLGKENNRVQCEACTLLGRHKTERPIYYF